MAKCSTAKMEPCAFFCDLRGFSSYIQLTDPSRVTLCAWYEGVVPLHPFAGGHPVVPAPFVEGTVPGSVF